MFAEQLVREGDPVAALTALQDQIRKDPSSAKLRTFLFQLLSVLGQWPRALTQLNVAGELDAATLPMVQTYREAIQCEALREEIFAGKRAPLIFGQPQPWLAQLITALQFDATDPQRAADLRAQAFDAAPVIAGNIDGTPFAWLADADQRLGPVIEAIINGRYFWIPFCRIRRIEIDAPTDLRDAVWTAASFTWTNGASTVGLIPTRYNDTASSSDDALRLARRTEWVGEGAGRGLGQRMFATEAADYALMDIRLIELDSPDDDPGEALDNAVIDDTSSANHG
ncbi:MAG: type VI secretion system protein ImpE [Candidatus Paceibacteria bacterium]|jgi:type VI secretion system protein ImpE